MIQSYDKNGFYSNDRNEQFFIDALALAFISCRLAANAAAGTSFFLAKKGSKNALWLCRLFVVEQCREGGNPLTPLNHLAKIASKLADAQTC